jgi:hypothetical protein
MTLASVLGIEGTGVWLAYLLCLVSAAFCIVYGAINWNKGDEPAGREDANRTKGEDKVEKKM